MPKDDVHIDEDRLRMWLRSRQVRDALKAEAEVIKGHAVAGSPVGATGAYKAAWAVTTGEHKGLLTARVVNTDYKALWIEYGVQAHGGQQRAQPARAVLRRAIEAAGWSADKFARQRTFERPE